MNGKAKFAQLKVVGHILGLRTISPPSSYFMRLHLTMPGEDGAGGTSPVGNGYAPKEIVNNTTNFVLNSAEDIENGVQFAFPAASGGNWGNIVGVSLWSASSGGNCWFIFDLNAPIPINDGQIFKFEPGDLVFTES